MEYLKYKAKILQHLQSELKNHNDAELKELSITRMILSEIDWQLLTDDEKQEHRKAVISLSKKWTASHFLKVIEESKEIKFSYLEAIVVLHDLLTKALEKININPDEIFRNDINLLRILAVILVEKDFINESSISNRHLPPYIFKSLESDLNEQYPYLGINEISKIHSKVYELWEQSLNPDPPA